MVWKTAERIDFHTCRVHFVGECMALVVAETPRKPMVEQADAFTALPTRPYFCHFDKGTDLIGWRALS